jgi:hypothetical protein
MRIACKKTEWLTKTMKIQIMVKMLHLHQVRRLKLRITIKKLIIILGYSLRINLKEEVKISYSSPDTRTRQVKKLRMLVEFARSAALSSTLMLKHNFLLRHSD